MKKFEKLHSLGLQIVEAYKEYHLKKSSRIIISAYIIVGIIAVAATFLALAGKLESEAYSFLAGTIVGYVISILSKQ